MEKRKFVEQYVLNRALCNPNGLEGLLAAKEAEAAWKYIENICPPENERPVGNS